MEEIKQKYDFLGVTVQDYLYAALHAFIDSANEGVTEHKHKTTRSSAVQAALYEYLRNENGAAFDLMREKWANK